MDSQDHLSDVELDTLLEKSRQALHGQSYAKKFRPFLLTASILLNAAFLVFSVIFFLPSPQPSYENGFASDLKSARSQIQLTEINFSGGVEVDHHGHFFTDPESQQYVGEPTPKIDEAWDHLLSGLNIDLGAEDLDPTVRTYQWPESGLYFTGLEVFHSLHCLNRLRQALYPDFYDVFSNPNDPSRHDHIGHCINHLRQALQCHADLTPMEWNRVGDKVILNTATSHTCRDFSKIHDWAKKRRTHLESINIVMNGSIFVVD